MELAATVRNGPLTVPSVDGKLRSSWRCAIRIEAGRFVEDDKTLFVFRVALELRSMVQTTDGA
jgi:hypothetical protein